MTKWGDAAASHLSRPPAAFAAPHGNRNRTGSLPAASHHQWGCDCLPVRPCRTGSDLRAARSFEGGSHANDCQRPRHDQPLGRLCWRRLRREPARAADLDATSAVDAVTVYPDGASVTRVITLDLPAGDNHTGAKDFPLTLDPSSLRVEGEAGAKLTIGAIDARPPRAAPPVNLPELDKRIEALKDERANLQGAIAAATARRKFAERFAEASPAGIGDKGEARPIAEWRAAFAAVAEEVASRRYRDPRRRAQAARSRPRDRAARSRPRAASRRASSRSGSISPPPPRPRRRCG